MIRQAALLASLSLAGCLYSLTPQDRTALQVDDALTGAAYAHLCRVRFDNDAGDVAAARSDMRAAHVAASGALRRNSGDAGAPDAGLVCP